MGDGTHLPVASFAALSNERCVMSSNRTPRVRGVPLDGLFLWKARSILFREGEANFVISSDCGVVPNLQLMFKAGGRRSALLEGSTRNVVLEADASRFSTDAWQSCADHHIKSPRRPAVRLPAWLVDGDTKTRQHFKLTDWLTREGMPCLGGSFLDGSLSLLALSHPRR